MTLQEITEQLKGELSPGELSQMRMWLAGEYGFISGRLAEILAHKPQIWNSLRKEYNSDKATERAWEATEDGINEMGYRMSLKSMEKMMSAIKTRIEVMQGESRNQY